MIRLTRLNRVPMVLNSDLIVHIEVTPDTVISLNPAAPEGGAGTSAADRPYFTALREAPDGTMRLAFSISMAARASSGLMWPRRKEAGR